MLDLSLLIPHSHILVGVSGGLDSVVLLDLLVVQQESCALSLTVAHLHHGIRGVSADQDAEFVEQLTKKYAVPFVLGVRNVPAYAKEHSLSLEDAARELRYAFLAQEAVAAGATLVAVAHHQNDQAETVILRLLRGSSLRGLSGMAMQRQLGAVQLIRPLLGVPRAALLQYAQARNLTWVEDDSNRDVMYERNWVRHEVLPLLATHNPNIIETLSRTADLLRQEDALLDALALQALQDVTIIRTAVMLKLDLKSLQLVHPALYSRVVHKALALYAGDGQVITQAFVDNFIQCELNTITINENGLLHVARS